MSRKVLYCVFWLLPFVCFSQTHGRLEGFVRDGVTQRPLAGAEVVIETLNMGVTTNAAGYYRLEKVPLGSHLIRIQYLGFQKIEKKIKVRNSRQWDVDLERLPMSLEVVEVTAGLLKNAPYATNNMQKSAIEELPVRDVGAFLRMTPNVSGVRKGGAGIDPVIRGFRYGQLNVQADNGLKIEGGCPNRMDPMVAHIELEDISRVEVIKGPYALRYGPGIGGVINLKTYQLKAYNQFNIKADLSAAYDGNRNGWAQHAAVYGGDKAFFFHLSAGKKAYGDYQDGHGHTVAAAYEKLHYRAQGGIQINPRHLFAFSFEQAWAYDLAFPALPMDERKDDTHLLSVDYTGRDLGHFVHNLRVKAWHSNVNHEMDNKCRPFSDTVVAISVIDAVNQGLRAEVEVQWPGAIGFVGVDFEHITKDGLREKNMIRQPGLPVKRESLWNNGRSRNLGVFADYRREMGPWKLVAALRLDVNQAQSDDIRIMHPMAGEIYHYAADSTRSDYTNMGASVGLTRELGDWWSLDLAMGRASRSPDLTERFIILLPIGYDQFDYLGDPQIQPEQNHQIDLTLNYNPAHLGRFSLNGFHSWVSNYITGKRLPPVQQKPLSKDVMGVKQFYNADLARLRGIEFGWQSPAGKPLSLSATAAYTYATLDKTTRHILNENAQVIGEEVIENDALVEIPPFEANVSARYSLFDGRLMGKGNLRMVAAQNHVSKAFYEEATPGFLVADASLVYEPNHLMKLVVGVNNLFNKAYYEHLNRNVIGATGPLYEPGRSVYVNWLIHL